VDLHVNLPWANSSISESEVDSGFGVNPRRFEERHFNVIPPRPIYSARETAVKEGESIRPDFTIGPDVHHLRFVSSSGLPAQIY
jgi:hypothetical protein